MGPARPVQAPVGPYQTFAEPFDAYTPISHWLLRLVDVLRLRSNLSTLRVRH